jgi:hypothetical protein
VATIIYYAPQAIRVRISCFALPGEVSLDQADYVSSEEPAYSIRAGSATPALPLIKLVFPVVIRSVNDLCLLFLIFSIRRNEVAVLKA